MLLEEEIEVSVLESKDESKTEGENNTIKADWRNSILLRTAMFGANGFFLGAHRLLNGKYLVLLGPSGSAASSLVSTTQTVVLGSALGFLLGTGLDFGAAVGKREYKTAGDIAKTATVLSVILSGISTGAILAATRFFPLMFSEETEKMSSDFFYGYLPGVIPQLFLVVGSQVAFQTGDWYIPPASMFIVLATAGGASYLLAFKADLGAFGIGLGGSVGSLLSATILGVWFLRNKYKHYELYTCHIDKFSEKMKSLMSAGWKLAAQRLTEWGNLLAITTIIGIQSNDNLIAINPGILYLGLFSPLIQGFAQAAGMIISKNKGQIEEAIQRGDTIAIENHHKNNIQAIIKSNLFGLLLGSTLAASFYLAKEPLTDFFLPNDPNLEIQELAENLLWINMVGLIPDAVRIISAGAFRAWNDLLFPTAVSTGLMSVIGIPCAYGLGKLYNPSEMMIYVRDTTIALSAGVILKRCHSHIKHDEEKLGISKPSLPTKERVRNNFPNFSQKETKCQSNVSKSYGSYSEHVPTLNDEHLEEAIVTEPRAETTIKIESTQTRPSEYKTVPTTTTFANKWPSFFTKSDDDQLKKPLLPKNQKRCAIM